MTDKNVRCLDQDTIDRFLDEALSAIEIEQTEHHLAECVACQSKLDRLVTDGRGWDELREDLRDLDTREFSEAAQEEVTLSSLQQWIGPTDDPESLGKLGRYEIWGVIGRGSAGIVLKASDPALNRFVAIKMLAPDYAYIGSSRKRFEREARAIAAVNHHNVIEVHAVDEFQKRPYIVMQYYPDGSLQNRIDQEGWMSTKQVCRIGMQLASGLAEAHRQGIIHRDIKPGNILIENGTERAVLTDFGLASVADEASMTRSGTIAGTPQYMSPEQAQGLSLDLRSDLFSLGSVMYAACTGRSPFRAATLMGVVHQVCEVPHRPIQEINPDIAPWLCAFIDKLLAKERNDRFQTAEDVDHLLASELAHLQMPADSSPPDRPWMERGAQTSAWKRILACTCVLLITVVTLGAIASSTMENSRPTALRFGIEPTPQEARFYDAKAAFDLAYQEHISEREMRGDMARSIAGHQRALELGYNPAQSLFYLACALAYQKDKERALDALQKATEAGFHNPHILESTAELNSIRQDPRMTALLAHVRSLEEKYQAADQAYFSEMNYSRAERLYREWLEECPKDEHGILMLAASLLEQGKYAEAEIWNRKVRHSVRYANFGTYNLGCIAAQRGNKDLAFRYLHFAASTGFTDIEHLQKDHHLISLREDPRFTRLTNRMEASRALVE